MNQMDPQVENKKTLMNSFYKLQETSMRLEELSAGSDRILWKMKRLEPTPAPEKKTSTTPTGTPDIIDLFDSTNERMNRMMDLMSQNLGDVLNMIE